MSSSREKQRARVPRRERGIKRVAAILEAAVSLFAEKGFDAVTMTEVAERAGAPIGSLYQFFPNKETLADAVLDRFGERLHEALDEIEERIIRITISELVDVLLGLLDRFQEERAAASSLIDSRHETSTRAAELRLSLRRRVARLLAARFPALSAKRAESVAAVVVHLMKAAARSGETDRDIRESFTKELKHIMYLYLNDVTERVESGEALEGNGWSDG